MTTGNELLDIMCSETAGNIAELLDFWLYECSLDESPSAAEVSIWRDTLAARGGKFVKLANLCQQWLDEEELENRGEKL